MHRICLLLALAGPVLPAGTLAIGPDEGLSITFGIWNFAAASEREGLGSPYPSAIDVMLQGAAFDSAVRIEATLESLDGRVRLPMSDSALAPGYLSSYGGGTGVFTASLALDERDSAELFGPDPGKSWSDAAVIRVHSLEGRWEIFPGSAAVTLSRDWLSAGTPVTLATTPIPSVRGHQARVAVAPHAAPEPSMFVVSALLLAVSAFFRRFAIR